MIELAALTRRLNTLEEEQARTSAKLAIVESERDAYRQLYGEMLERCRKLELGLRRNASEKLDEDEAQLSFAMLEMMLGEDGVADLSELEAETKQQQEVRGHRRRKANGRRPLPEELPRVQIEMLPEEVKREGLDAFERIGQTVTKVVERRPAALVLVEVVKPKFVRKNRDRNKTKVFVAATPELPIPRGVAGPGLLANTLVRRWQDHLPLHRLQDIYTREGLEMPRSTVCDWHAALAPLVEPVVAAMRQDAFEQPYLCVDATGVLVQAPRKCRVGHFWVLVAPERHVLFEYTRKHDGDSVDAVLAGYEGYLVADAHVVYDHLYLEGNVTEVNCWAHCRRYFYKALGSDPPRAETALGLIGALFKIERSLAQAPNKKRKRLRHKHSKPILERFFSWCDAQWPSLLEGSPIYDGVRYARNQREGLQRFLEDGSLPVDNNISERNLRRQAIGRKNWIFLGSDDGGRVNALFTSLLASCRMLEVEPWSYLRDLLCLLPRWPQHRMLELAPVNWPATSELEEVQRILDTNPYRQVTLDAPA